MLPDQLELLHTPGRPTVHPDGSWAVASMTHPSFAADEVVGQLWRIDLTSGEEPRRLTRGFRDTAPDFSPDGRCIAFLRADAGAPAQLHVIPSIGGEPVQVTDCALGVSSFCWSPDSRRLAFCASVPEPGRYGTLAGVSADREDPRHITTNKFQFNGTGWTNDRHPRLFVVEAPDPFAEPRVTPRGRAAANQVDPVPAVGPAQELTDGTQDVSAPTFSPNGDAILITVADGALLDDTLVTEIHRVDLAGGTTEPVLAAPDTAFSHARFTGDGQTLLARGLDLGPSGRDFVAKSHALYAAPAHGGIVRRLTDPAVTDVVDGPIPVGPDAALVVSTTRGTSDLLRVRVDGASQILLAGRPTVTAVAGTSDASVIVAATTDTSSPGEIAVITDGAAHSVTDFAAPLRSATRIAEPLELTAEAVDGYPVHGWALLPEGPGPHPVLLSIHGGPYAAYPSTFFDEFQIFVEAGYAVVACNPRGSAGYGQDHGAAIRNDFGGLDTRDVLTFLDHAIATLPSLDANRVGIQGGSYGGYLTAWIIAHDHRFSGAIVERGYLDPASFIGSSDIGWYFTPEYTGYTTQEQNRQSPTLLAAQVRTPTLVMHSEKDLRCPLAQALRYYADLRAAGVPTELLVFPGENHELSRSGSPWHRRQRFDAMLGWWSEHLPAGDVRSGVGSSE